MASNDLGSAVAGRDGSRLRELAKAAEALTAACEEDMAGPTTDEFTDDEAVGISDSPTGNTAVTFGMIRRTRAALKALAVPDPLAFDTGQGELADRFAPCSSLDPIDHFWTALKRGWDIEPREYFEREAVPMGFRSPVEMAVHWMWKRDTHRAPLASSSAPQGENKDETTKI